ncbi:MAG: tetratricopeptide repeat protein [Candidatus Eisenbacteria bacterium]
MSPRRIPEPDAPHGAALARARAGERDAAIADIERAVDAGAGPSQRAAAALALAEVAALAEQGADLAGAERALASALTFRRDFADLQLRHGRVLSRLGASREARAAIERALAREPRYAEARLEHAMLDAREGRVGEALEALRRMSREIPVREPRTFDQGLRDLERANWDAADSLLRRALRVADPDLETALAEARRDLEGNRIPEVVKRVHSLLEKHPAYPDLHALLGAADLRRGHVDDAVSALARALELNPDFLEARALFAQALEAMGAFSAAAEQAALVLECEPGHPAALDIERRWAGRQVGPRRLTTS